LVQCRELTSRAANAMQRNDYARAESFLAQAVETYAFDPETRRQYAETLWRRGAHGEALAQIDAALELTGQDPALLTRRAQWRLEQGDDAGALADADLALQVDSQSAGVWLLRGRISRQKNDLSQALADYHRALAIEPAHREALWEKARVHWLLTAEDSLAAADQQRRALAALHALLETYTPGQEPLDALHLAGQTYAALARHDDAAKMFTLVAQRARPDAELLYQLAESHLRSGRPVEALTHARQALAMAPEHAGCRELISRIDIAMGRGREPFSRR
jgi:tetratricopeptide (TPR) repeat protein